MTVQQAHEKLGDCNEELTRKTEKNFGWNIIPRSLGACEACSVAKATQKNVPKESKHEPQGIPNERIFLDIATIFLRDLKEDGIIWITTNDNSSDLFTKNLAGPLFEKHTAVYCGHDEYMQYIETSRGEGVRRSTNKKMRAFKQDQCQEEQD